MSELTIKSETRNLRYDFNQDEIKAMSMELANKTKEKTLVEEEKASVTKQYGSRIAEISANINKLANKVSDGFELREVKCEITYHKPETGKKTILRTDTNEEIVEKMEPFEFNLFNQPQDEQDPDEDGTEFNDNDLDQNDDPEEIDDYVASGAKNVEADSGDPVIELLKNCDIDGVKVRLPEGQLDKELFQKVKTKIEEIGGTWKAGRTQAFVFDENPTESIWSLISKAPASTTEIKKRTPSVVAQKMIDSVEIYSHYDVLVPCAGTGELLSKIWGQYGSVGVTVYELNKDDQKALLESEYPVYVEGDNFLHSTTQDIFEVAICHPPLKDQKYIPIIKRMYDAIMPGGTMVALTHCEWTTSRKKNLIEFRNWLDEKEAYTEEIPEKDFQETGEPRKAIMIKITKAE